MVVQRTHLGEESPAHMLRADEWQQIFKFQRTSSPPCEMGDLAICRTRATANEQREKRTKCMIHGAWIAKIGSPNPEPFTCLIEGR